MDVRQAIAERRSVRSYKTAPVEEEVLRGILEAARLAPSASNRQEWRFIAVRERGKIEALAAAAGQPFIGTAPVVIAGVSLNPTRVMRCGVPTYAVDVAIAMTQITLAATAAGLGTCWIGAFDQEEVKRILGVPDACKVVELMPLGYPADQAETKSRKAFGEVVSYEGF